MRNLPCKQQVYQKYRANIPVEERVLLQQKCARSVLCVW